MNNPKWKIYQTTVMEFFKSMGFHAVEAAKVEGVRGYHEIDVLVSGDINGIKFLWVIECKAWNSNIPKEKVLALASIISDLGADRGFLLSEKGFQSGAIRVAEKSNITLTSLADLKATTSNEYAFEKIAWRIQKAKLRLRDFKKLLYDNVYFPPTLQHLGELGILESMIWDAIHVEYPIRYRDGIDIHSVEEFLKLADQILNGAEQWEPNIAEN